MSVLRQVRLGYLLTRHGDLQPDGSTSTALDTVLDWSLTLSLGEQQRLAWARLLLAKPRLALLDEASSALDQELEADLYQALNASGITFVSIGHRPVLRQYHKAVLQLMRPQGSHAEASGAKNQTPAFSSSSTMAWELQDATADAAQ
uniref:ABC transporter domain-containing protein n=2 Tax=Dunaliella tertiolecta TaxID=3047 RepID=A0A7S3R2U4_DUNTE